MQIEINAGATKQITISNELVEMFKKLATLLQCENQDQTTISEMNFQIMKILHNEYEHDDHVCAETVYDEALYEIASAME